MRKIAASVVMSGLLAATLAWAQSQRTQQTQTPQQINEQPKGNSKSEKPKGKLREGDLATLSPAEATGVDAFTNKAKLDEIPRTQIDESPKLTGVSEEPQPLAGFEVPQSGAKDYEQPKPKPLRASEPPRVAPLTLLDLRLMLNATPLSKKVSLRGQIQRIDDDELIIRDDQQQLSLRFRVAQAEALTAMLSTPRVAFEVTASHVDHPTGPVEAISIVKEGQLMYLSERILEAEALTTKDRHGFQIRQLISPLGKQLFEGPCRRVYEVKVQFSTGRQQLTLAPRGKQAPFRRTPAPFR